jgi:hypothetical protein
LQNRKPVVLVSGPVRKKCEEFERGIWEAKKELERLKHMNDADSSRKDGERLQLVNELEQTFMELEKLKREGIPGVVRLILRKWKS